MQSIFRLQPKSVEDIQQAIGVVGGAEDLPVTGKVGVVDGGSLWPFWQPAADG